MRNGFFLWNLVFLDNSPCWLQKWTSDSFTFRKGHNITVKVCGPSYCELKNLATALRIQMTNEREWGVGGGGGEGSLGPEITWLLGMQMILEFLFKGRSWASYYECKVSIKLDEKTYIDNK